jgi:hypothetical protein
VAGISPVNGTSSLNGGFSIATFDSRRVQHKLGWVISGFFRMTPRIHSWRFPEMGVPVNHQFINGFSMINDPFWGTPISRNPLSFGARTGHFLEAEGLGSTRADFKEAKHLIGLGQMTRIIEEFLCAYFGLFHRQLLLNSTSIDSKFL